jgi:hypothetical protein
VFISRIAEKPAEIKQMTAFARMLKAGTRILAERNCFAGFAVLY